jgi:hypothetical protein
MSTVFNFSASARRIDHCAGLGNSKNLHALAHCFVYYTPGLHAADRDPRRQSHRGTITDVPRFDHCGGKSGIFGTALTARGSSNRSNPDFTPRPVQPTGVSNR